MGKVYSRPSFLKDLSALKKNHRKNHEKVCAVLIDIQTNEKISIAFRDESRIPDCVKYELSDGYRVVFQRITGSEHNSLIALCTGKHDHVDSFLDAHKGWVFDPLNGKMKELRLATIEETSVDTVSSSMLRKDEAVDDNQSTAQKVFQEFTSEMLLKIGVPSQFLELVENSDDPNSIEFMQLLNDVDEINSDSANFLLAYATGNSDTKESIVSIAQGKLIFRNDLQAADEFVIESTSDEFVSFDDPSDLEEILKKDNFEQWQLFLHPDQKGLVNRKFQGPARIRGISGSGKTVVAMHRARSLAKSHLKDGKKILFTTFNKALAKSASKLLDMLCGAERSVIEVTHLDKWCLDYISFRGLARPRYTHSSEEKSIQDAAFRSISQQSQDLLESIPSEYIWSEIKFIFGRFLHDERKDYLQTDRSGRGRPLQTQQRQAILELYQRYMAELKEKRVCDSSEFVRIAYDLRIENQESQSNYAAVIVDEVQDISELGLKLLHSLVGNNVDGLLLVGDNTQRIYTRGYSMRNLGIDVSGRSIILTKNYRNTRQILEASFPLISGEWETDARTVGVDSKTASPIFSVREGVRPAIVRCRTMKDEEKFLQREIAYLLKYEKYRPNDICVMARTSFYRELAHKALEEAKIPVYDYQAEEAAEKDGIRISSLHSAKGHEYAVVFIAGMVEGAFPPRSAIGLDEIASERSVLYVGMTRARDIVYLSHSDVNAYGIRLERSRFLNEISNTCDLLVVQADS